MKGIILAGGTGTRLYPVTKGVCKQLIPVYDKPMIYYPLSVLILAKIKNILIITTEKDKSSFMELLGDGSHLGLSIEYAVQKSPDGIAQALIIGEKFIAKDNVCLILGDNIFYGHGLVELLAKSKINILNGKSVIFGYYVSDPTRYGIVEIDENNNAISIEEKPKNPKSKYAVTGLYFFTNEAISIAKNVQPSKRGELEITSVNEELLKRGKLAVELMGRGYAWLDAGTHESLLEASNFIETLEKRSGLKIACIEEIVYQMGYISKSKLLDLAMPMACNQYGQYLLDIAE